MKKSVCILIENSKGEILLLLRDNKPTIQYPNQWVILGGAGEQGETSEETIAREMREELELDLRNFNKIKVYEWPEKVETVFHKKLDLDIDKINLHEGQKIQYFSKKDILSMNLAFHDNQIMKDYFNK